ncbi:MAG: hypothetical protein ABI459_00455 [Deltaproteobacteria bacterium]
MNGTLMERILIVEDDPIVLLDVSEGLRGALSGADIIGTTLEVALSELRADLRGGDVLHRTALISSEIPGDTESLQTLVSRGLNVILTNRPPVAYATDLPTAKIVERPFETATLITILSDIKPTEPA